MSPGSTTERVKRGLSFSPGEDLALARSFASTTLSTTDMTSDLYWEAVADIYKNQAETRIPRTAKSLLNRFTTLQRVVQKYLAASSAYLPRSGQVESDRLAEVMTLYRNTNKVQNTKGDLVPAPVFKSTDAAMLLSQCPKFLSMIGGPSATSRGYRPSPHRERDARLTAAHAGGMVAGAAGAAAVDAAPAAAAVAVLNAGRATASVLCATSGAVGSRREVAGATSADGAGAAECLLDAGEGAGRDCRRESDNADPESPTIAAAVPSLRPSSSRPRGVKRQKTAVLVDNQSVRAIRALTSTVADVGATLAAGNQQRTDAAAVALETRLVAMLEEGPEKRRRVRDLLRRTQNLGTPSRGGVTNGGTAVSAASGGTRGLSAPIEILAGQSAGQLPADGGVAYAEHTGGARGGFEPLELRAESPTRTRGFGRSTTLPASHDSVRGGRVGPATGEGGASGSDELNELIAAPPTQRSHRRAAPVSRPPSTPSGRLSVAAPGGELMGGAETRGSAAPVGSPPAAAGVDMSVDGIGVPGGGGLSLSVATSLPPATVRRAAGYSRPTAGVLVASPHRHVVVHGGRHGAQMELVGPSAGDRAPLESLGGAELRLPALDAPVHPPPPVAHWPSIIQEGELQMTGHRGGTASGDANTVRN